MSARVDIRDLVVEYAAEGGAIRALDGVSLEIEAGEAIGIVGESGSGKSTLGMAIGRVLAANAAFAGGDIRVDGRSVSQCSASELRALRRDRLGFVFQNPMSALDPTMRIGRQVALTLGPAAGADAGFDLLRRAGLDDPASVAASFPHELSGGMAQRVVIALAIARAPGVIIADEPTASLDASIQGVILDLLTGLAKDSGASVVIMSHDLRMVARRCARIAVMYAGRIVEAGPSARGLRRTAPSLHAGAGPLGGRQRGTFGNAAADPGDAAGAAPARRRLRLRAALSPRPARVPHRTAGGRRRRRPRSSPVTSRSASLPEPARRRDPAVTA